MAKNANVDFDVAIVGGGISGIYSGWRLLSDFQKSPRLRKWAGSGGKLKVAVFEGSDRIGGRLLSARAPGFPDTVCEIGGMRYTDTQHIVTGLVQNELKLPHYEQVVDTPENLVYVRGKRLRFAEAEVAQNLPYNLDWAESQQLQPATKPKKLSDPSNLLAWAIGQILPGTLTAKSADDLDAYLRSVKVDGTDLYHHGFWNLLARGLSPEAYKLARTMVGYDILASNANAVDLIPEVFGFGPTQKFYLLKQGYETVPWTLQQRFEALGGQVFSQTKLDSFDKTALEGGETGVRLKFEGRQAPVTARAIILAMPRRSLELLKPEGPVLAPGQKFKNTTRTVREMLTSVEPMALYKLFLAYSAPWWQNVGVSHGRSLTDIPLRQCYYWPINTTNLPLSAKKGPGGLIMAYNDQLNVDFWEGLTAGGPKEGKQSLDPSQKVVDFEKRLRKNWEDHEAPPEMRAEMHRQLMKMHGVNYAPDPVAAAFMDWTVDPYGGGVHFWNRGFKSWEVSRQMTQPVNDFPCYICGEAYSTVQTWAEGALQTAEYVLKEFGLPAPSWIKQSKAAAK